METAGIEPAKLDALLSHVGCACTTSSPKNATTLGRLPVRIVLRASAVALFPTKMPRKIAKGPARFHQLSEGSVCP
jgi:hypothetical protein